MMKGIVESLQAAGGPGPAYEAARESVARAARGGRADPRRHRCQRDPRGASLAAVRREPARRARTARRRRAHPVEALRRRDLRRGRAFRARRPRPDRAGLRADLVLLGADPTRDIAATRTIRGVWIAGDRVNNGGATAPGGTTAEDR